MDCTHFSQFRASLNNTLKNNPYWPPLVIRYTTDKRNICRTNCVFTLIHTTLLPCSDKAGEFDSALTVSRPACLHVQCVCVCFVVQFGKLSYTHRIIQRHLRSSFKLNTL